MKALSLFIFAILTSVAASSQLTPEARASLQQLEETLAVQSTQMIHAREPGERFTADSIFVRTLVKALRTPHSFDYPFDEIQTVSKIYPADSSFRIFTWQLMRDEAYFRQKGAIQMRTKDGSLKLFPLIDMSDFSDNPVDSVRTAGNWIGAIYYGIVTKVHNGKKYYTLVGYDENNFRSTRKWLEVLSFNDNGEPEFGGRFFVYPNEAIKPPQPAFRFLLEYKKDGGVRMNYDPELDMIIFDHLISETNTPDKKHTLIPDGDHEGFRWQDGKWVYVEKVFNFKLADGQFPVEAPIKDASGKSNEAKLLEQSEKNMEKAEKKKKAPAKGGTPKSLQDY